MQLDVSLQVTSSQRNVSGSDTTHFQVKKFMYPLLVSAPFCWLDIDYVEVLDPKG